MELKGRRPDESLLLVARGSEAHIQNVQKQERDAEIATIAVVAELLANLNGDLSDVIDGLEEDGIIMQLGR